MNDQELEIDLGIFLILGRPIASIFDCCLVVLKVMSRDRNLVILNNAYCLSGSKRRLTIA